VLHPRGEVPLRGKKEKPLGESRRSRDSQAGVANRRSNNACKSKRTPGIRRRKKIHSARGIWRIKASQSMVQGQTLRGELPSSLQTSQGRWLDTRAKKLLAGHPIRPKPPNSKAPRLADTPRTPYEGQPNDEVFRCRRRLRSGAITGYQALEPGKLRNREPFRPSVPLGAADQPQHHRSSGKYIFKPSWIRKP
jgi:hypothetical protein